MQTITEFVAAFWRLLVEMAPYLWLGFAVSFFLKWKVPPGAIRKHLGGEGPRQVVFATLAGIPLPLCSCGVLPVASAIRREGGGRGGIAAFTIATPQTGVDSIFATASLLGWGIAGLRLLAALLSGLLAGLFVSLVPSRNSACDSGVPGKGSPCCCEKENSVADQAADKTTSCCLENSCDEKSVADCCRAEEAPAMCCAQPDDTGFEKTTTAGLRDAGGFAFQQLPRDISVALLVGTALAALLVQFSPDLRSFPVPGGILGAYFVVSLLALPVYVCSTGVIPIAYGLIAAGFPPGAAFVLLTAGPSVSATSLLALARMIGWLPTALTALSLLLVTWAIGALVDFSAIGQMVPDCASHEANLPLWRNVAAVALLMLFGFAWLQVAARKVRG